MTSWEDYFYPDTDVLRNKFGIQDKEELAKAERMAARLRADEGCPKGNFDLAHIRAIHQHLFQDVYEWAGQLRTVDMFKNQEGEYSPASDIESEIRGVHQRILNLDFLHNTNVAEFSAKAAQIIGDTNHAHPFREGNTRTQLQLLQQLGEGAGHDVDLTKIERSAWNEAKIQAGYGSYDYMNDQIRAAIVPTLKITLAQEDIAELRKSLNERQEIERQKLLETHEAERAKIDPSDKKAVKDLAKRQDSEALEQDKRHSDEFARYIREREEALRLRQQLEEQRRQDDLKLEKSQERKR